MKNKILLLMLLLLGLTDSIYLTYEHYSNFIPPCSTNILFIDCGKVLRSPYSILFGIPLALWGVIHYGLLTIAILITIFNKNKFAKYYIIVATKIGILASLYFMYIQFIVIKNLCLYCTFSALISLILFILVQIFFIKERKELVLFVSALIYQKIIKPILFLIDPELVHESMLTFGEILGKNIVIKKLIEYLFKYENSTIKVYLDSKIPVLIPPKAGEKYGIENLSLLSNGIIFNSPIGLAAGFDYEAKLPQILPSLGFGFETIGTITNMPYEGNPIPRLGRLPKSLSLMVNKGFRNEGAEEIINKLTNDKFQIPIGISIGRTNSPKLLTQNKSIEDITEAFKKFELSNVQHSYYELNISCPNIIHGSEITFYPPNNLKELLFAVEKLKIKKPIFIKMPIEKSNKETLQMLEVISKFNIKGVIFGNLQKNRKDPALYQDEVRKFKVGNFSGKPTWNRSNELIKLAYKNFGKKLTIIGCGGVFSGKDAYTKIKLGASLIQLITGLIYQGPQLISQINLELIDLLEKDGLKNISQAVGVEL